MTKLAQRVGNYMLFNIHSVDSLSSYSKVELN